MRGERLDLAGLVAVVAEDDVAVEVVAPVLRGPLVADEGGEAARIVVLLGGGDVLLPGVAVAAACRGSTMRSFGNVPWREGHDDLERRLRALAGLDHVVPLAARRIGEQLGLAGEKVGKEAHVVRVVRDDEEIERARELHRLAARGRDLLAAREAIGVARAEPRAEGAGIHGEARCADACRRRTAAWESCGPRRESRAACAEYTFAAFSLSSSPVSSPRTSERPATSPTIVSRPARMGRSLVAVVTDRPVRRDFTGDLLRSGDGPTRDGHRAGIPSTSLFEGQGYSEARRPGKTPLRRATSPPIARRRPCRGRLAEVLAEEARVRWRASRALGSW